MLILLVAPPMYLPKNFSANVRYIISPLNILTTYLGKHKTNRVQNVCYQLKMPLIEWSVILIILGFQIRLDFAQSTTKMRFYSLKCTLSIKLLKNRCYIFQIYAYNSQRKNIITYAH